LLANVLFVQWSLADVTLLVDTKPSKEAKAVASHFDMISKNFAMLLQLLYGQWSVSAAATMHQLL
jgi:hypothetical protein